MQDIQANNQVNTDEPLRLNNEKQELKQESIKDVIEYPDFEKIDVRVGSITEVSIPDWSKKLLELTVDFGSTIGTRTILSGIKNWYAPQDLQGKKGMFIINLAERKMGPSVSQGMMLMADETGQPVPIFVPNSVAVGTVIR